MKQNEPAKTREHSRIVWHDYETENIDDKVTQGAAKSCEYAAIVTTPDLEIVSKEHRIIKSSIDVIPDPRAYLVHGVDPDLAEKVGMSEFEFARWIGEFYRSQPGTVVAGYNTLKFDSEVTRHARFRALLDVYKPEFDQGNFQFDLMKTVLLAFALSPETLNYKQKDDGTYSLKLEDLTEVNGISHQDAHSALSDVEATINVARIIKENNPDLWNYALWSTKKHNIYDMMVKNDLVVSVDTVYGQDTRYTRVFHPLVQDSDIESKFIGVDPNMENIEFLFDSSVEEIRRQLFTKQSELGPDAVYTGVQSFATNKAPGMVPGKNELVTNLSGRYGFDLGRMNKNLQILKGKHSEELKGKLQQVMKSEGQEAPKNPSNRLYSLPRFPSKPTVNLLDRQHSKTDSGLPALRTQSIAELASKTDFPDIYYGLALQTKFRTWPRELLKDANASPAEIVDFADYLNEKLNRGIDGTLTFDEFDDVMATLRKSRSFSDAEKDLMSKVVSQVEGKREYLEAVMELAEELRPQAEEERKKSPAYRKLSHKLAQSSSTPSPGF